MVELKSGGEFHTHTGPVAHDDILGADEGRQVRSVKGGRFRVWRPTLADYVLEMPRGAQVIYPKDLGPILMHADIFPGARVFESGLGSGALSMALLRAGAHITGYELRADFHDRARRNVESYLGADVMDRYATEERDAYEANRRRGLDRVGQSRPSRTVAGGAPRLPRAHRPGGICCAYTPRASFRWPRFVRLSMTPASWWQSRLRCSSGHGMSSTRQCARPTGCRGIRGFSPMPGCRRSEANS